ncbi:MAG TPA: AraC family ligand binding domain-containing protein, partial [Ideonella sp.]|nr:AraC family ligand binding domain-containing protein [Ideonella sp.]
MHHASPPPALPAAAGLPAYLLYGEQGAASVTERLHVETISSRSRLHDWEIKPHRHEAFFQILYIDHGRAEARLDAERQPLLGPCAVSVPAMVAHGFRFEPGVQGHVITVQALHLAALLAAEPALWARFAAPLHLAVGRGAPAARGLKEAVQALADEYGSHLPWRAAAI